jgi:hypothetical protein
VEPSAPPQASVQPSAPEPASPTLLGEPPKPPEIVAEPAHVAEAPTETKVEGQSDEPASLPTYEAFKLPEGVTLEEGALGSFTGLLAELEGAAKVDHATMQQFGQRAVDLYLAETQRFAAEFQKANLTNWEATKTAWKDAVLGDPEIGGNRIQATIRYGAKAIDHYAMSPEHAAEMRQVFTDYGVGSHPAVVKWFARAGMALDEGKPVAAHAPAPTNVPRTQKLYGRTG